jgi:hypothetical protein
MRANGLTLLSLCLALCGCVSGAPTLTSDQESRLGKLSVHKVGEPPSKSYETLQEISAADCSGASAGGRVWGNAERAVDGMKRKAVGQPQTKGQTYGEYIGSSWPRLEVSGSWCSRSGLLGWFLARLNYAHYVHCESVYSARSNLRDTQSRALV